MLKALLSEQEREHFLSKKLFETLHIHFRRPGVTPVRKDSIVKKDFARVTGDARHYVDTIEQFLRSKEIELTYEELESGADGVSRKGSIVADPRVEGAERFAVLAHELAHELLHTDKAKRLQTTKSIRETEAEAVARVVCRAVGLDSTTHSADYIRVYSGDLDILARSLDGIQNAAGQILEALEVLEHMTNEEAAA